MDFELTPKLNDSLSLILAVEVYSNAGRQGHNYSFQDLRGGLMAGKHKFGVAVDSMEIGNKPIVYHVVGGFFETVL